MYITGIAYCGLVEIALLRYIVVGVRSQNCQMISIYIVISSVIIQSKKCAFLFLFIKFRFNLTVMEFFVIILRINCCGNIDIYSILVMYVEVTGLNPPLMYYLNIDVLPKHGLVQTKFRSIALLSKSSSLDCSINEQSEIKSHPFKELNI
ncbi:hypothetical protein GLOIN_2v1839564 [Rhizophagus irregularis DAOM 181602=DAOM 197198]|uniref:Uncharacterized protein n=1 Tax=Rhizophagus irregularis (strain DAOM 181602 / DAOM 197198 / MUCL 43194) TaxID=747089 RepID=A0A2P4Q8P2_RHIID|nr:hypothetical protein GLOIN_2v1839564 [Rhizophagus irregularis DAOM 181602=DAOM 197198]POG74010.1 hypothetical protein GLOIN_2v1839564 [Rhizophagus irregularis DAOM 181602=DAOM 197198]GET58252.1 hypothetical protein GLOIN_2v1839564 [Rhizophagus irregularis DAOM 181602=DAOM 197198]|eukprot:XP_025180876.1 hypothetical protein GLOIN_2v1839564 [Rhizophagus irregularis DAOM 181602=DAOM 197198]